MFGDWREELAVIDDLMRRISRETDPQEMGRIYSQGVRKFVPADGFVTLSRRGVEPPEYLITRSSRWQEPINPWKERDRLPRLRGGLLGEIIYANKPVIIEHPQIADDDPAAEYLRGFELLAAMPQYDNGEALNVFVAMVRDASAFPYERYPNMVWQSNLYGRGVLNMVLRQQLDEAYRRLDAEFQAVGEIQRSLLPAQLPQIPTLDLAAHYETSQRAGGDYYDVFDLGGGRYGILIADVSGHGTPSAVIMAVTHALAHVHPGRGVPPSELLAFVNRSLATRYTATSGDFVTALYGIYDSAERTFQFARAGQNPPRILRNGDVSNLDGVNGLPLGLDPHETYPEATERFAPGEAILFYTDGITEAFSADGEIFGNDRLDDVLRATGPTSAAEMLDNVLSAVHTFSAGRRADDDRTVLAAVVK